MNATLKIYRVEAGRNGTLWAVQPERKANRLDEIRRRAIRETEQYLNDPDNATWARAEAGRLTPAAY
jgi:hypothetical protein